MIERNNTEKRLKRLAGSICSSTTTLLSISSLPTVSLLPRTCPAVKPDPFTPAELGEDTDLLTTFHLHCRQQQPALKTQLNPMFNPCSACVLGKGWERAGKGCACLIQQPGSQQCWPLMPAGQRAHGVFIAEQSVPITSPEARGHASAPALPAWLAQLSRRRC